MVPDVFEISVRELAEFVHRPGDLGGEGGFRRSQRALEGIKGHKRLQQTRGPEYQAEVPVQREFTRGDVTLRVTGRCDGLIEGLCPLVEEIKTVEARWTPEADPVHLAQLRLYAGILAHEKRWLAAALRLTYLELDTDKVTEFGYDVTFDELSTFLAETVEEWFAWLLPHVDWLGLRNRSIENAAFPFPNYRAGQHELARQVYRSIRDERELFIEAPTGMGKTLATLYPAVRALPILADGKVFYLTAKTPGRLAAQDSLDRLRSGGVRVRSVELTAKGKICFVPDAAGCDPATCPFLKGYYDRYKPAMRELLSRERLDREAIEAAARNHNVCPYELSLDVSAWVDVIIGDFNYAFDPSVKLQRYFGEGKPKHVALVDEAHNLVDRSREMYSATLGVAELSIPGSASGGKGSGRARSSLVKARRALEVLLRDSSQSAFPTRGHHNLAFASSELPQEFIESLTAATRDMEMFLIEMTSRSEALPWLETWFALYRMLQVSELYDETYRTVIDPTAGTITLLCLDPSKPLAATLKGLRSAVFFSGTLSPLDYFKDVLGGKVDDASALYASPFSGDQMKIRILPLDISFQQRSRTLPAVSQAVADHVRHQPGNHLVFSPSMAYLDQLTGKLATLGLQGHVQAPFMNDAERGTFLSRFKGTEATLGLAVLGGIFSEGIDLPGAQLIGVTVIGVGLPGLSLERDLLAAYFDAKDKPGFDYAYRFPGMQRVLQAVGRLIRSEEDQGSALLIDRRFMEERYQDLFPNWWRVEFEQAASDNDDYAF